MSHPGEGFKAKALRLQPVCAVCGKGGPVQIHHVIPKKNLRYELGRDITEHARWDIRNVMTLCDYDHGRHHSRMAPISARLLSPANWEFAAEHGLEWFLERNYPTEDTDGI